MAALQANKKGMGLCGHVDLLKTNLEVYHGFDNGSQRLRVAGGKCRYPAVPNVRESGDPAKRELLTPREILAQIRF